MISVTSAFFVCVGSTGIAVHICHLRLCPMCSECDWRCTLLHRNSLKNVSEISALRGEDRCMLLLYISTSLSYDWDVRSWFIFMSEL